MSEKRKPQESMQRRQQNGQQVRKPRKSTATSRVSRVSKSKKKNDNRGMIVGISLVVIMLCAILLVQTFNAYGTLSDLKKQKKELTQEYNDQLELSDELMKAITNFQDCVHNTAIEYHRKVYKKAASTM